MKKGTIIMNIENIIRGWKDEEDLSDEMLLASPVGEELTEEDLYLVNGGCGVTINCTYTCGSTVCDVTACAFTV